MIDLGFIPDFQFQADPFPLPSAAETSLGFVPSWQLSGLGAPADTANAVFDSFWWRNRKWLALGAVAVLGLGVVAIVR